MEPENCGVDTTTLIDQYRDAPALMPLRTGGVVVAELLDDSDHPLYVIRDDEGVRVSHAQFEDPIYPPRIPTSSTVQVTLGTPDTPS